MPAGPSDCPRVHAAAAPNGIRRAIFLDRDGVLVDDPGFLSDPDRLVLMPGAAAAVRQLRGAGWRIVVATNQSGVARGLLSEAALAAVHDRLLAELARGGAELDALYYCPHHEDGVIAAYRRFCPCRKPGPGMLQAAAGDLDLDLARCWMIGDRPDDVAAGAAAGCRTILIAPGAVVSAVPPAPSLTAPTLIAAAAHLVPDRD